MIRPTLLFGGFHKPPVKHYPNCPPLPPPTTKAPTTNINQPIFLIIGFFISIVIIISTDKKLRKWIYKK